MGGSWYVAILKVDNRVADILVANYAAGPYKLRRDVSGSRIPLYVIRRLLKLADTSTTMGSGTTNANLVTWYGSTRIWPQFEGPFRSTGT